MFYMNYNSHGKPSLKGKQRVREEIHFHPIPPLRKSRYKVYQVLWTKIQMEVKTFFFYYYYFYFHNGQVLSIAVPSEVFNTSNCLFKESHPSSVTKHWSWWDNFSCIHICSTLCFTLNNLWGDHKSSSGIQILMEQTTNKHKVFKISWTVYVLSPTLFSLFLEREKVIESWFQMS